MACPEHQSPSGRETLRIIDVPAIDFGPIPAATAPDVVVAVPGVNIGDIVLVTPLGTWPVGLSMLPHRVLADDAVSVRLVNSEDVGLVNPDPQTLRFAVFRPIRTGADRNSPSGRLQKLEVEVLFNPAPVANNSATDQAVAVPGARVGDTIIVTPQGFFNPNVLLGGPHRCLADGIVQVRFANVSDSFIDIPEQVFQFTIYRVALHPDRQSPSGREQRKDVIVTFNSPSIPAETALDLPVLVPTSKPGDSIIVTPLGVFDVGLGMGPHRVFEAGTVNMRIGNVTAAPIDPVSQDYRFSLIRCPGSAGGPPPDPPSPAGVPLLTAGNFAVLAQTGITNVPVSSIIGDMGVSPAAAASITGFALVLDGGGAFSTSAQVTGQVFASDYAAPTPATLTQAVIDMQAAYTDAAGRAPDFVEFNAGLLGGQTLVPGVYKWSTGVTISTDITLQGGPGDVFIFEIAGVLTLAAAQEIILSGGVLPENVFWQVAGNTLIDTTAVFRGVILCLTDITLNAGATMFGRTLAQTAVNFSNNTLTQVP